MALRERPTGKWRNPSVHVTLHTMARGEGSSSRAKNFQLPRFQHHGEPPGSISSDIRSKSHQNHQSQLPNHLADDASTSSKPFWKPKDEMSLPTDGGHCCNKFRDFLGEATQSPAHHASCLFNVCNGLSQASRDRESPINSLHHDAKRFLQTAATTGPRQTMIQPDDQSSTKTCCGGPRHSNVEFGEDTDEDTIIVVTRRTPPPVDVVETSSADIEMVSDPRHSNVELGEDVDEDTIVVARRSPVNVGETGSADIEMIQDPPSPATGDEDHPKSSGRTSSPNPPGTQVDPALENEHISIMTISDSETDGHSPGEMVPDPQFASTSTNSFSSTEGIPFDMDEGVVRLHLRNTTQLKDFPKLLARAERFGAKESGIFKLKLPRDPDYVHTPVAPEGDCASTFNATPRKGGTITLERSISDGQVQLEACLLDENTTTEELVDRFEKNIRQSGEMQGVRYCVDLEARTVDERKKMGLPDTSPIWPLQGNLLDKTRYCIPGIHWPFAYKAHSTFGAPFACHKEDGDTMSLNILYMGVKVWITIPPQHERLLEDHFTSGKYKCAQFIRHKSTFIPRSTLSGWGVSYRVTRQSANEIIVVYPHVYHQGFSAGSTSAEAVNYVPSGWSISGYAECRRHCPFPIPNAKLEFRPDGAPQLEEDDSDEDDSDGWTTANDDANGGSNLAKRNAPATVGSRKRPCRTNSSPAPSLAQRNPNEPGAQADEMVNRIRDRISSGYGEAVRSASLDTVASMVMAVGSDVAMGALEEGGTALQPLPSPCPETGDDPKALIQLITAIETGECPNTYMRRIALAQLASVFHETAANGGQLVFNPEGPNPQRPGGATRADESAATRSMIEHIWNVPFPTRFGATALNSDGLIASNDPDACQWNTRKKQLDRRLNAGKRWLQFVITFGRASLMLMTRKWSAGLEKGAGSDAL